MKEFIKFIKFNVVGVINTLVDMGAFAVFVNVVGINWQVAQVMSYSLGILNSYVLNRKFTFQAHGVFGFREFMRFIIVNMVSLGFSIMLMKVLIDQFALSVLVAKLFSTGVTMVINYTGNRLWTFKDEKLTGNEV